MKTSLYLLSILALLLQPGGAPLPSGSAGGEGARSLAPEWLIHFVKPTPSGNASCSSWANACSLQTALTSTVPNDMVWVQQGVYKPEFWGDRTDFTFVAWVYWEGGAAWQRIFDFGGDPNNYMMLTPRDHLNRTTFEIRAGGSSQSVYMASTIAEDTWMHIAVSLSGTVGTIYINGIPSASMPGITHEPAQVIWGNESIWLGKSQYVADPFFNGKIDEVAVFDRALSQTEIDAVKSAGWASTSGKVFGLHLEENPAEINTILVDSAVAGYGGILTVDDGSNKSRPGPAGFGQAIALNGGDYITLRNRRQTTFNIKGGILVYGGFAGVESGVGQRNWQANVTTLSGEIGNLTDSNDNSYHVVTTSGLEARSLDGFTLTSGFASAESVDSPWGYGGGLYNDSSGLLLRNLAFNANAARNFGGGMSTAAGNLRLDNVVFNGNIAGEGGGGLYTAGGAPTLTNVTFTANNASLNGGGMYTNGGGPILMNVTFTDNWADNGAGMYTHNSSPNLYQVTFTDNWADNGDGGGMYTNGGSMTLTDVTFTSNTAASDGGGMHNLMSSPILNNVTFSDNIANTSGGGVSNDSSNPALTDVDFSNNSAQYMGGGMYNHAGSPTLTGVEFTGNTAYFGGGLANHSSHPILTGAAFVRNFAHLCGGGMFNDSSSPILKNMMIHQNTAFYGGGVCNYDSSSPVLVNTTLWGNATIYAGGGILNRDSNPTLINVTIWGNSSRAGGGIYSYSHSNPVIKNSILWSNIAGIGPAFYGGSLTIRYSDIQGGCPAGAACTQVIASDPSILDSAGGNLRLLPDSAAIDTGENASVPSDLTTDLAGSPRIRNYRNTGAATVDMGAYEAQPTTAPAIIYVDKDAPAGAQNGASWNSAFQSLQSALAFATGVHEIWVAHGIYYPSAISDRAASFQLKNNVAVYGGFTGVETSREERNWTAVVTVLSGDIGRDGNRSGNSYHVVTGSGVGPTAILDGFTITFGYAQGPSPGHLGAGMFNDGGSPTLAHLTFVDNLAVSGGGMGNTNGSSPTLTDVFFFNNRAGELGGGMYNDTNSSPMLSRVDFTNNLADNGGGMFSLESSPTLTDVDFYGNTAETGGGGMLNQSSNLILIGGGFNANIAETVGGAMLNINASPALTNVTFSGNTAGAGSGMANIHAAPALINCTFSNNTATIIPGALYNDTSSPTLTNCILWGDTSEVTNAGSGSAPVVSYSIIQGGCAAVPGNICGDGNLHLDPLLDPLLNIGRFTLVHAIWSGSPAIDSGSPIPASCPAIDQRGAPRPIDGDDLNGPRCDMGAVEADPPRRDRVYLPLLTR